MSENGKLRMVDDFAVIVQNPVHGQLPLTIRVGAGARVRIRLSAEHDELLKLRSWMEDIARGISPALVSFADGTSLSCTREYDDEAGFAKTERYLDEFYPTSISALCMRDAQGGERRGLLKTKHFLNALYINLLTGGKQIWQCDYLQHFRTQWYAYTPLGSRPEHRAYYSHYRCFPRIWWSGISAARKPAHSASRDSSRSPKAPSSSTCGPISVLHFFGSTDGAFQAAIITG